MFALRHLFLFGSPVLCFHRIDSDLQMSNSVPLILREVGGEDDELEIWLAAVNLSKRLEDCANAFRFFSFLYHLDSRFQVVYLSTCAELSSCLGQRSK